MQFNQIYDRTKHAFEHGEVYELLMGYNGYDYQAPMVPVSIPTHINYIFSNGIYPLYSNSDEQSRELIVFSVMEAMRKLMMSDDPIERWWALSICYGMKLDEDKRHRATFYVVNQIIPKMHSCLIEAKSSLCLEKRYGGCDYENGLWGDVQRYNRLFHKYFNINVMGDI